MRQLSKHDVNKLTAGALTEQLPFQITNDGEVIAIVWSPNDVTNVVVDRHLGELRFSKSKQAKGKMPLS